MSSHVFRNAEEEFKTWIAKHPEGFVINTTAKQSDRYFVLHRASCTTLHRDVPPGGYTERDYMKICSSDATPASLELWVHQMGGPGFTKVCAVCHPAPLSPIDDSYEPSTLQFETQVAEAGKLNKAERAKYLPTSPSAPTFYTVTSVVYARNPYVVAEVLNRANGQCESCRAPAPFLRKHDGTPYLEVHHRTRLADGGHDTVDNAIAVCPNCHRKAHFGSDG